MKRIGYLHEKVYDINNIEIADSNARKHKTRKKGIIEHDKHREYDNIKLSESLKNLSYKTSEYKNATIYEPKERLLYILPYYPDRITHHAIMNIMEPIWTNMFISNTYSCIKGRGIHKLVNTLKKDLSNDIQGTKYCLKIDIRKFYPSIKHPILMDIINKGIKDKSIILLLSEIVYSADGVPIGNYLSQFFANLYLTYFDHWVKEELKCKYYYRYADEIVVLSSSKEFLRSILLAMKIYLKEVLDLELKPNYQIFPVESRGIDYVGYKFYHTHILLRKSIKIKLFKLINSYRDNKINKEEFKRRIQSYFGWPKHCNSKNLLRKIEKLTNIKFSNWRGQETIISKYYNKVIYVVDITLYSKYYKVNFMYRGKARSFKSRNKKLLSYLNSHSFPNYIKIKRI